MEKHLIIGLDASTSCVGWCLGGNRYTEDYHVINTGIFVPEGDDVWARIIHYGWWLRDFLQMQTHVAKNPIVVYERPTGNRGNMDTNLKLGALMYETIVRCRDFGVRFIEVTPSQVKATGVYKGQLQEASFITGKEFANILKKDGTLNKAQMDRQDNEIDAIGVWLAGLKILQENRNGKTDC